jgi:multidrug efflux system membrane fusion protein
MRLIKPIFFLTLIAGVGFILYMRFLMPMPPMGPPPGGAMPVGVAEVIVKKVQQWQEFSGRLVAVDSAEIRPRVSGTIDAIHFQEGQLVKKGDKLFTIDPRPYQAALQSAEAQAVWAQAELERAKSLLADKAIPQREFEQRKNAAEIAQAALTRAKLDMDYSVINAPIAGRVSRAEITVGNLVDAGGMAPVLTRIVSDNPIYADFDIDENSYLQYLKSAGSDASKLKSVPVFLGLAADQDANYAGSIQSFDNQLDPRSGTLRVRAVFSNDDGKLIPGLFARVRLGAVDEREAILITDRAIGTDQTQKFVFVVGEKNIPEKRVIKPDGMADGMRIVSEGLSPGDKIIVTDMQKLLLMPGMPVEPKAVQMDGQSSGVSDQVSEEPKTDATKE